MSASRAYLLLVLITYDHKYNVCATNDYSVGNMVTVLRCLKTHIIEHEHSPYERPEINTSLCVRALRFYHLSGMGDPSRIDLP